MKRNSRQGSFYREFQEGVTKIYDLKPLFEQLPVFCYFREHEEEFFCVSADKGGYGIVWNDELDLSCDELWDKGVQVDTPFDGLMSFADATELWGLNESTLRKAITYGKLINGVDVCKFGKQWVISVYYIGPWTTCKCYPNYTFKYA